MARLPAWLVMLTAIAGPPEATAQRLPAPAAATLRSRVLAEDRMVYVALPESYERGAARYPVVYLTDADWNFAHTRSSAQLLGRNRIIPEVIVVGVTHADRVRDLYATRADFTNNGRTIRFPTSGNADHFLEFVEGELIPWVERSYRTSSLRIFAGHSAGGNFALHALRTKPRLFQAVIAASPWLAWDDKRELRELLPFVSSPHLRVRALFLSHSSEAPAMKPDVDALVAALRQRRDSSVRWVVREYPDETHDTNVLKSFYDGLRTVFAGYAPPRDPATYGLIGSLEDLRAHFAEWGRRLGVEVEPPVEILNELGARYLAAVSVDLALAAFRFSVARNPESAAAWSSLGVGLQRSGRRGEALVSHGRAIALAERQRDPNLEMYRRRAEGVATPH